MRLSRSKLQAAQFDDVSHGGVVVVVAWPLVVEITHAERSGVSAMEKSSCGRSTDDL